MQMNLNSRLFHLTKYHRSAKQNVFMNGKANGVLFFPRLSHEGKNISFRVVQIPNLKMFANCPQRMVLKGKDQFYCNIIFRIFSEVFFPVKNYHSVWFCLL